MNLFRIPNRKDDLYAAAPPYEIDPARVDETARNTNQFLVLQSGHDETPVAPHEIVVAPHKIYRLNGREADLARAALEDLRSATLPDPEGARALEKIIRTRRPALEVRDGRLEGWRAGRSVLGDAWQTFRTDVMKDVPSVGRIESRGAPIGTGFVVDKHIIVTNRHVVDQLFPRPDGTLDAAGIRFGLTALDQNVRPLRLAKVLVILPEPLPDLALVRLDPESPCPPTLGISTKTLRPGDPVSVIGYPFADARVPAFAAQNFLDNLSILTVCPGMVLRQAASDNSLDHDCQTLGGNSGSPLISVTSGKVVGVHYEGRFLEANSAVNGKALKELLATVA